MESQLVRVRRAGRRRRRRRRRGRPVGIEARGETVSDEHGTCDYTSSKLLTKGSLTRQYGRIDITELIGDDPDLVWGTAHGPGWLGQNGIHANYTLDSGVFADDFHGFSLVWDPNQLKWCVDGEQFHSVTKSEVQDVGRGGR